MKDEFQLSSWTAVIYPLLLFIVVMITCFPKVRCINLDRPKCQFVRRRTQRTEDVDGEIGSSPFSRTFIDCPLFPCIEFVSETTSNQSGSDWYLPSDDSMVDVVINETTYSVPLSLMMPNCTAWKWEKERRRMIRSREDGFMLKRSVSLPCISNLYSIISQQKLDSQTKCMQTIALTKSPFTISSKLTRDNLREGVIVDVKGDGNEKVLKDSNLGNNVNPYKTLISKNISVKNTKAGNEHVDEGTQWWFINKSKSLDRDNYSPSKALKTCRLENEMSCGVHHSLDYHSYTYHQNIESNYNRRMKDDFVAVETSFDTTDNREVMKSPEKECQAKLDMDDKTCYKTMPATKMQSYTIIPKNNYTSALPSKCGKIVVSKAGASHYRSADSISANPASPRKEHGANSISLNCLDEKDKHDGKSFEKQLYSPFTCVNYESKICPTCNMEFPSKLCNCSSGSSKVGTDTDVKAPFVVMEDEVEICPYLLEETPSGLYLNPSSTSRIVEEERENDFTSTETTPSSSYESKSCSYSDNENYTKKDGK